MSSKKQNVPDKDSLGLDGRESWRVALQRIQDSFWENSHEADRIEPFVRELHDMIREIVAADDAESFRDAIYVMESSQLCSKNFPDLNFDYLLDLMKSPEFLRMTGSHHGLYIFDADRKKLSPAQERRLLAAFEKAYGRFADWMSCFLITEFAERLLNHESGFQMFCRLATVEREMARSFIPHAFEHIVTDTASEALARSALTKLLSMKNDPSEKVRGELAISLYRIVRKRPGALSKEGLAALNGMKNDASESVRETVKACLESLPGD
jgi:hypothetical protein